MNFVKEWQPEKFKAAVVAELEKNAGEAGQFVVDNARQRLQAIRDPEWGTGYRRNVVASLLRFEVERRPNEVIILVGVARSPDSRHHGFYIELGSSTAPAQPYLRPAVFQNAAKIVFLLSG